MFDRAIFSRAKRRLDLVWMGQMAVWKVCITSACSVFRLRERTYHLQIPFGIHFSSTHCIFQRSIRILRSTLSGCRLATPTFHREEMREQNAKESMWRVSILWQFYSLCRTSCVSLRCLIGRRYHELMLVEPSVRTTPKSSACCVLYDTVSYVDLS